MHQIKRVVNALQRHRVRNQIINIESPFHIPIDNRRHICTPSRTTECAAVPRSPRNQLEGTSRNFLPCPSHTDNVRRPPTLVRGLQCLTHHIDVTDTLERVIGPTLGQLDNSFHYVVDFLWIDEVGHTELLRQRRLGWVDINTNDLPRSHHASRLNHVQPNTTKPEHNDTRTWLHLGLKHHSTDARRHTATDIADLIQGGIAADLGKCNLRQHRIIG